MCIPAFVGTLARVRGCGVARISLVGVIAVNEIPYLVQQSPSTLSSNIPRQPRALQQLLLDIEQGAQSWFITWVLVFKMVFIHCMHFRLLHSSLLSEALHRQKEHGQAEGRQQARQPGEEGDRGQTYGPLYVSFIILKVQATPIKMRKIIRRYYSDVPH